MLITESSLSNQPQSSLSRGNRRNLYFSSFFKIAPVELRVFTVALLQSVSLYGLWLCVRPFGCMQKHRTFINMKFLLILSDLNSKSYSCSVILYMGTQLHSISTWNPSAFYQNIIFSNLQIKWSPLEACCFLKIAMRQPTPDQHAHRCHSCVLARI